MINHGRLLQVLNYDAETMTETKKRKDRISGIAIRPVALPAKQLDLFS
jgi:hypothetical protein